MSIFTKFQEKLIKKISLNPKIRDNFFLTGGTALSAFYLEHRYSEDLDFFTHVPLAVKQVVPLFNQTIEELQARIEYQRSFETFVEATVTSGENEPVHIHFAEDVPYRLSPLVYNEEYGIFVDSLIDISCNKFSALFDRHEMKDFVDVYFIDKEVIRFEELYLKAKKKHVGLDDYWLVQSLRYINEVSLLPRMVKVITIDELRSFFNQKIVMLMSRIEKK